MSACPQDQNIETRLSSITERLGARAPIVQQGSKSIDLSLDRIERFLNQIGNPHLHIPPAIHVAGTNGKGSSIAFLKTAFEHIGSTCHTMTSPHLVRFNERIVLAGDEITDQAFMDILDECEEVNAGEAISYFEMAIAATYLAFSRTHADISLIETGLGGRLDATNVIKSPKATLITAISFDHQDFLGDTLQDIAYEKAGIMKSGAPCVIGAQSEEAINAGVMSVFEKRANDLGVPLLRHGHEWNVEEVDDAFLLMLNGKEYRFPRPSLAGAHQINNAGAVLSLILTIMPDADIEKLGHGIANAQWRGRLQPLPEYGQNVILDGGHNDSAGVALAKQAQHWKEKDGKPLHLIVGMLNRKDPLAFVKPLLPYVSLISTVDIPESEASFTSSELQKIISPHAPCPVQCAASPKEAIKLQSKSMRHLIAGSLYLVGSVLADIENVKPQKNEW